MSLGDLSRPRITAAGLTVMLAMAVGLGLARPGPITAVDQEQPRLNQAAPIPRGSATVSQSFQAGRNGLSAVEVLAVVHAGAGWPVLTLRLFDGAGAVVAAQTFRDFAHNAALRLDFPPLADSADRTFQFVLEGSADNNATAWAYSLDGYARGQLQAAEPTAVQDLRFTTTYTYLWPDLLADSLKAVGAIAVHAVPLWLLLFAPGLCLLDLARVRDSLPDRWARWGLALAVSLAGLPLVWQWGAWLGLRWSPSAIPVFYGVIGLLVAARLIQRWRARTLAWPRTGVHDLALSAVLLTGLAARLLAVRDLALPAWVDSPHHYTIARLLAETGSVPAGYQPVLPVETFTYHFGWHALSVVFSWLSQLPLAETMLFLGQVLNGLMPLATYTFVGALTGRRGAGLAAAFFVGVVSFFPAYYVSWGRYSQLAGLIVLAPLLASAWCLVVRPPEAAAPRWGWLGLVGVLAGGLALVHYRVLAFFVTFALVALAAGRTHGWKWMSGAAIAAIGLSAPWLWRLWGVWIGPFLRAPGQLASSPGYNDFPVQYFVSPLERAWIGFALAALIWGLWRRDRAVWGAGGWLAVTFALLNIGPGSWVVNNNAWAISLFLPGAFLVGWGAAELWALSGQLRRAPGLASTGPEVADGLTIGLGLAHRISGVVLAACLAGMGAYAGALGLRGQVAVLNPATVLATADDREALDWVTHNTPPEAVFLANSWLWLTGTWAGPDGGAWLWPLAGRQSTMPPVDYIYEADWASRVRSFNERLAKAAEAGGAELQALVREAGATHIFIGARGGVLKPETFANSPDYRLVFSNGAAWVFARVNP